MSGRVVLLTIGMSNTRRESEAFVPLAMGDPETDPHLVVVDVAINGQGAAEISSPDAAYWQGVDLRLADAGVTPMQVQAIRFKEANKFRSDPFPQHADTLVAQFQRIMHIIHQRYSNTRLCYCSSRIYAGYASTLLNPEPYAYESGFAVKWLIEAQIDGDPALAFNGNAGEVRSPWLSWGPYLWADGTLGRSDGLTWECDDFDTDGTHPAPPGSAKVANLLLDFFKSDVTTVTWFRAPTSDVPHDAGSRRLLTVRPAWPNPSNPRLTLPLELSAAAAVRVDVVSPAGRMVRTLVDRVLGPGRHAIEWDGTDRDGRTVASGTYLLRVEGGGAAPQSVKATLVR